MPKTLSREVFENLYKDLEKPLFNIVYRWVWNEAEAMDLVQEAFCRVWARRHRVVDDTAKAYVYRTALNLAANRKRSKQLWQWRPLDEVVQVRDHPEAAGLQKEREDAVRQAVSALPERFRRVLLLCRFAELSHEEVGRILQIPAGTVASRQHKALKLLRKKLKYLRG